MTLKDYAAVFNNIRFKKSYISVWIGLTAIDKDFYVVFCVLILLSDFYHNKTEIKARSTLGEHLPA